MLTIEYQTETGDWVKAVDRTWATRRGVEHWLNDTIDGGFVKYGHEHVRITGEENRRKPSTGMDPTGWVHVGDIFRHRWGYDTIHNDFYEVIKVSGTGRTCTIRRIATIMDGDPCQPGGCMVRPQLTGADRFIGESVNGKRVRVWLDGSCTISMGFNTMRLMEPEDYVRGFHEDHCD
ncbi:hypothetical protein [Bifidobacterium felsineum]|uniref:hypothetical protein n=1 Tax=Bifidobacterium felsineum TaxID=2045440 RepID=UPI001BDBD7ED|nr:hypothetical protein [Bifidobacterium felsineum]MBT1164664.1 hypothetical protein [Bifidobacterium felsineum]